MEESRKIVIKHRKRSTWSNNFSIYPKCQYTLTPRQTRAGWVTGLSNELTRELEKDMQLNEGELAKTSKFWKNYAFMLTDKDLILDLTIPVDRLNYELCKVSKKIANSINDLHLWPKSDFVIYDAEEDAKNQNKDIAVKASAIATFMELTPEDRKNYLKLLGKNHKGVTDPVIYNKLFEVATNEAAEFNSITEMKKNGSYGTRVLLSNLVTNKVVRVNGKFYYYGDQNLGNGEEQVCAYLDDHENNELRIKLEAILETKVM